MITTQPSALLTTGRYPVIEAPRGHRFGGWLDQLMSSLRSAPDALGLAQAQARVRIELDRLSVNRGGRVTGHVCVSNHRSHRVSSALARIVGGDTNLECELEASSHGDAQELIVPFAIDVPEHVAPTWSLAYESEHNEGYQVQIRVRIGGVTRLATAPLRIT